MAEPGDRRRALIIGVGNRMRGDDGAGLQAARRIGALQEGSGVSVMEAEGEPVGLIELWDGEACVVLVDAMRSGARAGTIHRVDATSCALPSDRSGAGSTHALGLAEAIELARALGRMPERLIVLGIEGERFEAGEALSAAVEAAIPALAEAALAEGWGAAAPGLGIPPRVAKGRMCR